MGKFSKHDELRKQLDELGYKNIDIWNILIKLRDNTLSEKIQKQIQELELEIKEIKNKHCNIGIYTREYQKIYNLTNQIEMLRYQNLDKELIQPLETALDNLYYSTTVETKNRCMKIAIKFIQENLNKEIKNV